MRPVRAMQSHKQFSLEQLKKVLLPASGAEELAAAEPVPPVRERGGRERRGLLFAEGVPDIRESAGTM